MSVHPRLYAASVEPLRDDALYARALLAATPARREKTARLVRPEDRRLSLGAELLLRRAFMDAGEPFPARMEFGAFGKPFFPGADIRFNLSHAGEYALCAVCDTETGCDIEKIVPAPMDVAQRFFSREEALDILSQPTPAARDDRFFRLWTVRESYVKALGTGITHPLNAFRVSLEEPVRVIPDEGRHFFREFPDIPGYRAAMCAEEDLSGAELVAVNLSAFPGLTDGSFVSP